MGKFILTLTASLLVAAGAFAQSRLTVAELELMNEEELVEELQSACVDRWAPLDQTREETQGVRITIENIRRILRKRGPTLPLAKEIVTAKWGGDWCMEWFEKEQEKRRKNEKLTPAPKGQ